jgi:hypothetical protein
MSIEYTVPLAAALLSVAASAALLVLLAVARVSRRILRRSWRLRPWARLGALGLILGALSVWATLRIKHATVEQGAVDLVMTRAPRPPRDWRSTITPPSPYLLLAGDLHCHINPPDWSEHVARHLPETVQLARAEQLDFVSLVPHVWSNFPADAAKRKHVQKVLTELQNAVDARPDDGLVLDVGVEYTDPTGHVGMVFGDVPAALAATPRAVAAAHPEAFFDAFADRGGVLVIHHPLLTPIPSRMPLSSIDISWQPFTGRPPFRPEIAAVDARAGAVEVDNLFVSAVRDRFLLGDREDSTRRALALLDREIRARGRRLTPVGGTDSHSFHLRPMTFVLAEQRSRASIRDAIRAGRTCVGMPGACTLEARVPGGNFAPVGSSLSGVMRVEARASGRAITLLRNGEEVAAPASGEIVSIDVSANECSVLRATVDGGYSAPIYVNCPFAEQAR